MEVSSYKCWMEDWSKPNSLPSAYDLKGYLFSIINI